LLVMMALDGLIMIALALMSSTGVVKPYRCYFKALYFNTFKPMPPLREKHIQFTIK